jgi:hypothetical protein
VGLCVVAYREVERLLAMARSAPAPPAAPVLDESKLLRELLTAVSKALDTPDGQDDQSAVRLVQERRAEFTKLVPRLKQQASVSRAAAAALLLVDTFAICDLQSTPFLRQDP